MKVLVIGNGRMGRQRAQIALDCGCQVSLVGRGQWGTVEVSEADRVFVCTRTKDHFDAAALAIRLSKPVFIEKTLGLTKELCDWEDLAKLVDGLDVRVGYTLRFIPELQDLKIQSELHRPIMGFFDCGQALNLWGHGWAWKDNPIADVEGGGVIYEMSHEIDLVNWMMGRFTDIKCVITDKGPYKLVGPTAAFITGKNTHGGITMISQNCFSVKPYRGVVLDTGIAAHTCGCIIDSLMIPQAIQEETESFVCAKSNRYAATLEDGIEVLRTIRGCENGQ